jgi:hypothetical protein
MLRQTRTSRLVVTLAAGVVAGLPLLAAGPAVAATPRIDFSGSGAGLLSCRSKPSDSDLTVPAESTVIFVNKIGDVATLRINGRNAARVSKDESTEVLFHRGTVRIEMVPDCGLTLASDIEAVSVTVAASGGAASGPSTTGPARPGGSSPADAAGSQSSRGSHRPGVVGSPSRGRSASASPSGPAAGGIASPPDAGAGDGTATGDDEGVAAEPVSTAASSEKDGPNGLLVVIAIVCVVGVSTGAIRAIAAQRATRTSVA